MIFIYAEKKVKSLTLHPQYNLKAKVKEGVDEFYDYDLAIIRLEEPVNISKSVRYFTTLSLNNLATVRFFFIEIAIFTFLLQKPEFLSDQYAYPAPRRPAKLSTWLASRHASNKVWGFGSCALLRTLEIRQYHFMIR